MNNKIKEIEELKTEIAGKKNLIVFLRLTKLSKGLNEHDIQVYEEAKSELVNLNERLSKMQESQTMKLVLSQNA